jgi:hypothetical protein
MMQMKPRHCQDGQTHNAEFHVTEVQSRKLSECMFYKFHWRALRLTNFTKNIFLTKKKSESKMLKPV